MCRGTHYRNHCGNGNIGNSGPCRVFFVVSLSAGLIFRRADWLDYREEVVHL